MSVDSPDHDRTIAPSAERRPTLLRGAWRLRSVRLAVYVHSAVVCGISYYVSSTWDRTSGESVLAWFVLMIADFPSSLLVLGCVDVASLVIASEQVLFEAVATCAFLVFGGLQWAAVVFLFGQGRSTVKP
ncbi:MAG: hypothetical protein HUU22_02475 [Phycisphaerae bacterium]|nr:hypothetical protein [Phycisphaerae bacterium]NUQ44880.1 hypothetical protein [Phycisphaerae bacterium]